MKDFLAQLVADQSLSVEQTVEAFEQIMTGQATPAQAAALLAIIEHRGATVDEIVGAATVMRSKVAHVEVPAGLTAVDTCGTGGDHANTFNISTAAALVTAAAGRPHGLVVAKHGNRSVTSQSGSSQVLETLGVKLKVQGDTMTQCLAEAGLCFCFAPAHHPAMRFAAPIRAELGFRTIFNILGPLTNPAGAQRQVMGVFASDMTRTVADVLQRLGAKRAMVVHGQIPDDDGFHVDGLDELSTCGPSRVSEVRGGKVKTYTLDPDELGLSFSHPKALKADGPEASANIIRKLLVGEPGPPRDIVALNAAAALMVGDVVADLVEGIALAEDAIDSGAAAEVLEKLVAITTSDPTPVG